MYFRLGAGFLAADHVQLAGSGHEGLTFARMDLLAPQIPVVYRAALADAADFSGGRQSAAAATAPGDIAADTSTTASIAIGGSMTSALEAAGDKDWVRITLSAGDSVSILLAGSGTTPVADPFMVLRDAQGNFIVDNDDGGGGYNSQINFVSENGGTYYIEAGSYNASYSGQYTLSVSQRAPLPLYSYDQIAFQLTNEYWGGSSRNFNVGADGQITINIEALTPEGQFFALNALDQWSDVTGIEFRRVTGAAEITFDDNEPGAYGGWSASGGFITSSHVNISTDWIAEDGTNLDSYSFQTYLHEIGHALGLGHAGNYDGDASFGTDASYLNDAWSTTVMSYFSQPESTYFAAQRFSYAYVTSPMIGDVVAIGNLYGLSTTTRTGDTTYGFNSTAGRAIFDATLHSDTAYTVFDSGGIDTLDYSGYAQNQVINLNAEAFSSIGGLIGNVAIARGTVIENAIGGGGADTITGNAARNSLAGGAGADRLFGSDGADRLFGEMGDDRLIGGRNNDYLDGGVGRDKLFGNGGSDQIYGGGEADTLYGQGGSDALFGDDGADTIYGGSGNDALSGGASGDSLFGEVGNDQLRGGEGRDTLNGGDGDDTLIGELARDILFGGAGSDRFQFDRFGTMDADTISDFQAGIDLIVLDRAAFAQVGAGVLASGAFVAGTAAQDANDRIIYDQSSGQIFYDSDGVGGAEKQLFATVTAGTALTAASFTAIGSPPAAAMEPFDFAKHGDATLLGSDAFLFV